MRLLFHLNPRRSFILPAILSSLFLFVSTLYAQENGETDRAGTLFRQGVSCFLEEDLRGARAAFSQALPLFRSDTLMKAESYLNLGAIAFLDEDFALAIGYYEQALFLLRSREEKYSVVAAQLLGDLGGVYAESGNPDRALSYYREAKIIYLLHGPADPVSLARLEVNTGAAFLKKNLPDSALRSFRA
ncbi:MAG TPA: tetratricopeptide repeat protein, partial [Bacteroidales bacterium]|nr:tetratricopeptide repeat protein [Bacteroidales bacterium]